MRLAFGIRDVPAQSFDQQKAFLGRIGLDQGELFVWDKRFSDSLLSVGCVMDTVSLKSTSMSIPQIRVFDHEGKCLGGWQQCWGSRKSLGVLDRFPPLPNYGLEKLVNQKAVLSHVVPYLISESGEGFQAKGSDYVIMVFWMKGLGVFNKGMLQDLDGYFEKYEGQMENTRVVYVNLDGRL
jgi:hypothetical protein